MPRCTAGLAVILLIDFDTCKNAAISLSVYPISRHFLTYSYVLMSATLHLLFPLPRY